MHTITRCFFVLALATTRALAADKPADPTMTPIEPRECKRAETTPVGLLDLVTNIEAYVGKCVVVRGMTSGYHFYADIEDFYRMRGPLSGRRPSLGLYAPSEETRDELFGWRQTVEVVAFANTCKHLSAAAHADDDKETVNEKGEKVFIITMLTGYCHYTSDPVLHVSEFKVLAPGPIRLIGDAARQKFGDSDDLLPDAPIYAEVSAHVRAWFDAVRRRDVVALYKSWHAYYADLGDKDAWPMSIFWDKDTPLRFLIDAPALPPIKYYVVRFEPDEIAKGDYYAYGCMCRTNDCTGQWPINSVDARIKAQWPYVCVWAERSNNKVTVGEQ